MDSSLPEPSLPCTEFSEFKVGRDRRAEGVLLVARETRTSCTSLETYRRFNANNSK